MLRPGIARSEMGKDLEVRTLTGMSYLVKVHSDSTVLNVKEDLVRQSGSDIEKMKLFSKKYNGGKDALLDDDYIEGHEIEPGVDFLFLMLD